MFVRTDGKKIRELREAQGLSKKDLARLAKVTQATVARVEDSQQAYPTTVELIGGALGVDPRTLANASKGT